MRLKRQPVSISVTKVTSKQVIFFGPRPRRFASTRASRPWRGDSGAIYRRWIWVTAIKGYHQAACCHCVAVMAFFGHITHFFGNRSQAVTRVMIRFRDLLHR
jgi:uracil-DNA glycosylase